MSIKATDVVLTGTFSDSTGTAVNGTVTFTLGNYGSSVPTLAGSQLVTGTQFSVTTSNGTFTANFYSNQIISPGPLQTTYTISFSSSGASQNFNFSNVYQFSPGTYDISQLTPLTNFISNTSLPNTVTPHTFAAASHQFLNSFTSTGNFTAAQPAASDLSNGVTGSGAVVLATAPTVSALAVTGLVSTYNNIATAGNGLASVYASTSQKSETGADTNLLTFTPPASVGTYRLRFVLSLSAASSATVGWTATWKDSNGNAQTPTNLSLFVSGTAAPALTFTTSAANNYYGDATIDTDASATNIVVKLTFSGSSFAGKASATIERLV